MLSTVSLDYPDWMVTVSFYVALQAIDALLAHDKVERVTTHDTRNQVLGGTNKYSHIWRLYQPLYSLSRTVRYLADPTAWVPADQIEKNVLKRYLYPIEASVQRLTKHPMDVAPVILMPAVASQAAPPPDAPAAR